MQLPYELRMAQDELRDVVVAVLKCVPHKPECVARIEIHRAVVMCGSVKKAAEYLGMRKNTLLRKIRELNIKV